MTRQPAATPTRVERVQLANGALWVGTHHLGNLISAQQDAFNAFVGPHASDIAEEQAWEGYVAARTARLVQAAQVEALGRQLDDAENAAIRSTVSAVSAPAAA